MCDFELSNSIPNKESFLYEAVSEQSDILAVIDSVSNLGQLPTCQALYSVPVAKQFSLAALPVTLQPWTRCQMV